MSKWMLTGVKPEAHGLECVIVWTNENDRGIGYLLERTYAGQCHSLFESAGLQQAVSTN